MKVKQNYLQAVSKINEIFLIDNISNDELSKVFNPIVTKHLFHFIESCVCIKRNSSSICLMDMNKKECVNCMIKYYQNERNTILSYLPKILKEIQEIEDIYNQLPINHIIVI